MAHSRGKSVGAEFHAQTKYRRGSVPRSRSQAAPSFKVYANPCEVAALPVPQLRGGAGLWSTLSSARGGLAEGGRLRQAQLSQLLWGAAGFTFGHERTHLSAAGVSSIETYLVARQVQDLFAGVYHYNPREHSLEHLSTGDPTDRFAASLVTPLDVEAQAAALCFTGIFARHRDGGSGRALRYLCLDVGAAAQAVVLSAAGMGLATSFLAEFYDDELAELLQVDGRGEVPLGIVSVGA
ncbi:MAG TPA: SagB/ThcOx family dehydrogenase [Trueperaceae bacterium]|nr:SagB/ThcOx family dehydrogenase [Trueperaceae bacterium]